MGLILSLGIGAQKAAAADITYDFHDSAFSGQSLDIQLQGVIEPQDAARMAGMVAGVATTARTTINVTLDSPGGNLMEGIRIGRFLADLPNRVVTRVFTKDGQPADCASACVFAYMGGDYRFLGEGSRLGVHQFYFGSDGALSGADATATSQIVSSELADFLTDNRVRVAFLKVISDVPPDQIYWVPEDVLSQYRVVTGLIHDQSAVIKVLETGGFYLRMEQTGFYGQNKMLAACDQGRMEFYSYIEPVDIATFVRPAYDFQVMIDGVQVIPTAVRPEPEDPRWVVTAFLLAPADLRALTVAKSFGARHDQQGAFFGFDYAIEDDQLAKLISGCRS
jgi:hypothetical protein